MRREERASGRRLPVGAEVLPDGGVEFRVWAPRRRKVEVVLEGGPGGGSRGDPEVIRLDAEEESGGYFSGVAPGAGPGTLYRYRLDGEASYPDPASRFQPQGPHGPSEVIDPAPFAWSDRDWRGVSLRGQVLYEIHIGTFTREGTWEAAANELAPLAELGVTSVEVMPVAEFPGRFGWGYDGVDLFAPYHAYGRPDDFRRFVDQAHALGLGVLLDVVYNHLGPEGNYLRAFADDYISARHKTEWGDAINFGEENSGPVREFFLANAAYWVEEFHVDGLRLDATQAFFDDSTEHILTALVRRVRASARGRATLVIGENEPQRAEMARPPERGGHGIDALCNDDFHHIAMIALTRRAEAYYSDYRGTPQEFVSALKRGYLYQGQRNLRQGKSRGTPALDLAPETFVNYLQSHDQVANSLRGDRAHRLTGTALYRAMTAVLLLAPGTPMLFQGQEFAASSPFLYFADHEPALARRMGAQRAEFLSQFPSLALPEAKALLADPADPATFERSKLDHSERPCHGEAYVLHRDLLRLRRDDPVFRAQGAGGLDGAVLGPEAFVVRYFGGGGEDRLLVVNLGQDFQLAPITEPLLAAPAGGSWEVIWSSEDVRYGGTGTPPPETDRGWRLPGRAAAVLAARPRAGRSP
jgi:maltooligosyltrehalose trehalohydrolase